MKNSAIIDLSFVVVTAACTGLSIALGAASAASPDIASLGWAIGTLIAVVAGAGVVVAGGARERRGIGRVVVRGALAGGTSICIGCLLGFAAGAMPLSGVVAATLVGDGVGALAALVTHVVVARRASASAAAAAA